MNPEILLLSHDPAVSAVINKAAGEFLLPVILKFPAGNPDPLQPRLIIAHMDYPGYMEFTEKTINESPYPHLLIGRKENPELYKEAARLKSAGIIFDPPDPDQVRSVILTSLNTLLAITELKGELQNSLRLQVESAEIKKRFMATINHEIRTPMNAIVGMTDLALLTNDSEEVLDYLIDLKTASGKLLNIMGSILDFSRAESGELKPEPENFSIRKMADSAVEMFQPSAAEKGLTLTGDVKDSVPDCCFGDHRRIRQVIDNLLDNAVRFTPAGFVKLEIEHSPGALTEDKQIILTDFSVSDSGIGIDPEKQETIFNMFSQAEDTCTRRWGGIGLGLTIAKTMAELMQGKISVQSKAGHGSRFLFTVPLLPGTVIDKVICEDSGRIPSARTMKILVVEDNPVNARMAGIILKRLGHFHEVAVNGLQAIDMLKGNCYDVIFMDIEMPVMDGIETTKQIRAGAAGTDKIDIPIVAVSAYAVSDYENECLNAGMNYFLTKPVNIVLIPDILGRISSSCDN